MKSVKIKVAGKVQGVFFRASTKNEAEKLNLTGFVKNVADGGVYIEAQGSEKNIDALVQWAHKGPIAAKVTSVEVEEGKGVNNFTKFEIIR